MFGVRSVISYVGGEILSPEEAGTDDKLPGK